MVKLIGHPAYTERIKPFIGKDIIKVLTGQRRVGKSCILKQIQNYNPLIHRPSVDKALGLAQGTVPSTAKRLMNSFASLFFNRLSTWP